MKFRLYEKTKWVKTDKRCGRDGHPIYQEVGRDGTMHQHFSCERPGCTWPDYHLGGTFPALHLDMRYSALRQEK